MERRTRPLNKDELLLESLKKIEIFPDGRASLYELYKKHFELVTKYGWKKEVIYSIDIESTEGIINVPVHAYLSPKKGKALWFITGIHGEEPAGPNAAYNQVDEIGQLGQEIPMVAVLMANPAGYYRDWRFHNFHRKSGKLNVTDASHVTTDPKDPSKPKIKKPVHKIADTFIKYVLKALKNYPPRLFVDPHEDDLINEGYIYSQGELARLDPVAVKTIKLLVNNGVHLQMEGCTRFPGELIKNGIVTDKDGNRVQDGSIDEFMANPKYFDQDGNSLPKPFAKTSIVIETPSKGDLSLADRIRAHESIIVNLKDLWQMI